VRFNEIFDKALYVQTVWRGRNGVWPTTSGVDVSDTTMTSEDIQTALVVKFSWDIL